MNNVDDSNVDASLTIIKKVVNRDPIIESIVLSPNISAANSMYIDIFDMGYVQSNLLKLYEMISSGTSEMINSLSIDKIKDTISTLTDDPWDFASKQLEEAGSVVEGYSDMLTNNSDKIMEELKKKLEELTKPNLIISKQIATLQVPIPNHISDALNHEYNSNDLNVVESIIRGGANLVGGTGQALIEKDIQLAKRNNFVFNPNNMVIYQGTKLREYSFDIEIMPQKAEEVKNILKGMRLLKQYASADTVTLMDNDIFLTMSGIFKFRFNSILNELMDIRAEDYFYLTNIRTSYGGGAGSVYRFYDGTPKNMVISLTFRERLPQYLNDKDKERLDRYNVL